MTRAQGGAKDMMFDTMPDFEGVGLFAFEGTGGFDDTAGEIFDTAPDFI